MARVLDSRTSVAKAITSIGPTMLLVAATIALVVCGPLRAQAPARSKTAPRELAPQERLTAEVMPMTTDPEFHDASQIPGGVFFNPLRPKLIVLIHGQAGRRDTVCGHLTYARKEWGFKFVQQLLGAGTGDLYTFSNVRLNEQNWPEGAYYIPPIGQRIATVGVDDNNTNDHFVSTAAARRDHSLMLTYRDGSRGLAEQAAEAVNQIFRMYNQTFPGGEQPQILLMGHSMGGLVSRFILSNPFRPATKEHFRANFLRNRTVLLVTLATPHEGSRLANCSREVAEFLQSNPPLLEKFYQATGTVSPRQYWLTTLTVVNDPSTMELKTQFMLQMNQSSMAPQRAVRNDGTPIPTYVLGARTPGGGFLNSPTLATINFANDTRKTYEVLGCVGFDTGVKNGSERGWGEPPTGSSNLDWVQRVSLQQIVTQKVTEIEQQLPPCMKIIVRKLGGLLTASGLSTFDITFPVYLDTQWEAYLGERQVPFKHWECGQFRIPWEDCKDFNLDFVKNFLLNLGYNLEQLASCLNPANWHLKETVTIPCVKVRPVANTRCADGEIDNDGLVSLDSALGLRLGTSVVEYFDHTKTWPAAPGSATKVNGSWYRFYDGPWNLDNHGSVLTNPRLAAWLYTEILRGAGPLPGPGPRSTWPPLPAIQGLQLKQPTQ